jgi:hypothetical protein
LPLQTRFSHLLKYLKSSFIFFTAKNYFPCYHTWNQFSIEEIILSNCDNDIVSQNNGEMSELKSRREKWSA